MRPPFFATRLPFFSNRKAAALYREISGKNRGNSLGRGYQFRLYTDRIHISWRTPESYAGNSQRKPLNLQRLSSGSIPSLSDRSALFWGKKLWSIRYDRYERSLYGSTKGFVIRSRSFYRACYESPDSAFSFAGWRKLLCYTAFTGISGRWAFYLLLLIQARNYTNEDIWYLYQFSLPESDVSDTRQSAYIHQIKNILPHGVVLYFEHSIVAVCRRRDFDPDYEKSYAALEDLLKRLSLKVYISTRFFRFTDLSMAYGQCRLMKSYPLEPQKHIQRFDEAFPHVLYGVLKEKNSLPGFCHPAVLSLWQSHMEQDLTLIHTLKCYLINGRNISETARTLHLHRNTLIYRLRKIEDLLHIHWITWMKICFSIY